MPKTQITSSSNEVQFCRDCQEHWIKKHVCHGSRVSLHQLMDKIESLMDKVESPGEAVQEIYFLSTGPQYSESPLAPYSSLALAKEGAVQWQEAFGGDIAWRKTTSDVWVWVGESKRQILKKDHIVYYQIYRMKIDPNHVYD